MILALPEGREQNSVYRLLLWIFFVQTVPMNIILYILIGLSAGFLSGLVGIGGGIIMVPALVYLFGYTQHMAQGTALAIMVPPVGLLAAWVYYKQGNVNLVVALFVCLGFFLGGLLGATAASHIDNHSLRKIFGVILFFMSIHMIFFK